MEKKAFYDKFTAKKSSKISAEKQRRKEFNKERDEFYEKKRRGLDKKEKIQKTFEKASESKRHIELDAKIISSKNIFNFDKLPEDCKRVLETYDSIVQSVRPLNSRQMQNLPKDIRALSHQLTDERETRRAGYMNANEELSAYVRYFTWWNLVRLTRVFANLPDSAFNLKDGDVILDIGSGPLTVVTSLWLSRPELRSKRLTVYTMDISQSTMACGEDIYLSVASKALPKDENAEPHWNIIRVKGEIGTSIRKKANLITCANMFNELYQKAQEDPEVIADRQIQNLLNYADERCSFFIAEPGMPVAGRFVSLMRERFIKNNHPVISPCSHQGRCPMDGNHARYGGSAKWCNYSFSTEGAPKKLLRLSEDAGLPKERAVISYIFAGSSDLDDSDEKLESLNIVSDPIWLPGHRAGFYACSDRGLVLAISGSGKQFKSGDKIKMSMLKNMDSLEKDKKSGALQITL